MGDMGSIRPIPPIPPMKQLYRWCFLISFLLLTSQTPGSPAAVEADRAALLSGVTEIGVVGAPGPLCIFGPEAFSLISGKAGGDGARLPVVAAGRWERGRVVAFGHEGYLGSAEDTKTGRLLVNSLRWAGAGAGQPRVAVHGRAKLASFLKAQGFAVELLDGKNWCDRVGDYQVVCTDMHSIDPDHDIAVLARFVRGGGGLVASGLGWGWLCSHADKRLSTDFPGNRLLAPAGIVWGDGCVDRTTATGYAVSVSPEPLVHALGALRAVMASDTGTEKLSKQETAQAERTLSAAVRSVPPEDALFLPRLGVLRTRPAAMEFPRPDKKLNADRVLARVLIGQDLALLQAASPVRIRAHPAAEAFPGSVPANAERVRGRSVTVDNTNPQRAAEGTRPWRPKLWPGG